MIYAWRIGPAQGCLGLDSFTVSSEGVTCNITWPASYGWTGASMIFAESATAPGGWCIAPNLWVVNGSTIEAVADFGCRRC
jgi:hypothetical protein